MEQKTEAWEVDDIDLDLRHYSGHPTDVIKKIKLDIEKYLSSPKATEDQRMVYSAIYNALEYYSSVSYIQPADFDTEDSFLSCAIDSFNRDFEYLSKKYNSKDITAEPVISFSARIKSPLSFVKKIKEKASEYIAEGRDLKYFNESLRDLLGARIVVNPPDEIKKQGEQAECDFLYGIFFDLMNRHGITGNNSQELEDGSYVFIDVNTRHNPHKQQRIKERFERDGVSQDIVSKIFVPTHRIPEVEQPCVDSKLKDYVLYPKESGYQSLHICVIPDYSDYMERKFIPNCIIPPATPHYYVEYQFRTEKQNEFAEHGLASHKMSYKPEEIAYHRLAVPYYIEVDGPHDVADNHYSKSQIGKSTISHLRQKKLKFRNFAESYERFYGHTFEERFGISFKDFRDTFSMRERDQVLALQKVVVYDKENDLYRIEPVPIVIPITEEQKQTLIDRLQNSKDIPMNKVLDELGLIDGQKGISENAEAIVIAPPSSKPRFKLVPVVSKSKPRTTSSKKYKISSKQAIVEESDQKNQDGQSLDD